MDKVRRGRGGVDGGRDVDFAHFDLRLCQGGCRQTREDMDEGIDGGSVSGVLQAHGGLEFIKEGFHDESFAQQHLIQQGHQIVFHVTANAGDQVKAPLPEALQYDLER